MRKKEEISLKYLLVMPIVVVFVIFLAIDLRNPSGEELDVCGDGSSYGLCSSINPYYCEEGVLVQKASVCGCDELAIQSGESCVSKYATDGKEVSLDYVLRGEEDSIDFMVYTGLDYHLSKISRAISYGEDEEPLKLDFKLKSIDEEEQRLLLLPLVLEIQKKTSDKEDQARIAISLVQNIPYGSSEEKTVFFGQEIPYSRHPYEVLYDNQGVCEEKTSLLAFLLRELDYEVYFFYYLQENHEALGIGCPVKNSFNESGICFVETTGPAIITDDSIEYFGGITLQSPPEVFSISSGLSLGENLYEYKDAKLMKKIREGKFVLFKNLKLKKLQKRYGLVDEYYVG